jgi:hypothetical protein
MRYNIAFDHARRRVSWQSMFFDELQPDASCAACTYDAKARHAVRVSRVERALRMRVR